VSSIFDTHPAPFPVSRKRAFVYRVIDGDTYWVTVDLGYHCEMTIPVRLRGVDTPELGTTEGDNAKLAVRAMIEGQPILLTSFKDHQSFARWIGDVLFWVPELKDWYDLGAWLVEHGAARKIEGASAKPWPA
jgi:endonuclease YncB( thermonuclease family)